jgi:biofilm protein TabA
MIVTDLRHIDNQTAMTLSFRKAIEFLRLRDVRNLPDGTVEIDGSNVYAIIQRYETANAGMPKFEYHRKYLDIQFIADGEEIIGWTPAESIDVTEEYSQEKDICFGTARSGKWTPVYLSAGQLAILYPEDGHAPRLAAGAPVKVMKIVIKVAV